MAFVSSGFSGEIRGQWAVKGSGIGRRGNGGRRKLERHRGFPGSEGMAVEGSHHHRPSSQAKGPPPNDFSPSLSLSSSAGTPVVGPEVVVFSGGVKIYLH